MYLFWWKVIWGPGDESCYLQWWLYGLWKCRVALTWSSTVSLKPWESYQLFCPGGYHHCVDVEASDNLTPPPSLVAMFWVDCGMETIACIRWNCRSLVVHEPGPCTLNWTQGLACVVVHVMPEVNDVMERIQGGGRNWGTHSLPWWVQTSKTNSQDIGCLHCMHGRLWAWRCRLCTWRITTCLAQWQPKRSMCICAKLVGSDMFNAWWWVR